MTSAPEAEAFGGGNGSFLSIFKGRNSRNRTEGRVPINCTGGCPSRGAFRNEPLQPIPRDGLAGGVSRVMATIYGACEAARPLNSIEVDSARRNQSYGSYLATDNKKQAMKSSWKKYIPGFKSRDYDVREITNSSQFVQAGPYGAAMRGRVCRSNPGFNVTSSPKTFGYGSGGAMVNGQYNILRCGQASYLKSLSSAQKAYKCGLSPNSQPAITLDCAEFLGAAAIASCKKFHKNQTLDGSGFKFPGGRELSTASMISIAKGGGGSCLTNNPTIGPNSSIQAGDMFAGSSAHSVMISSVGNDPLGIAAAKRRRGGCDSISYGDLNFTMAHSPSHTSLGPINTTARAYARMVTGAGLRQAYPLNKIIAMAITICKRQANGGAQSFMNDSKFSLLRHKSSDPACSYSKKDCPPLTGDECADECGV